MNTVFKLILAGGTLAICTGAFAQEFRHPHYLHALSDLRAAQWQVDHRRPEDGAVREDELVTSDEIAAAIASVRRAAMADDKEMDWTPPPDAGINRDGRLHAAMDLVRRARSDIAMPEDDPNARGQQGLALLHLDAALHAADRAFNAVRQIDDRRE